VATILGIFPLLFFFLGLPLFKNPEGVVKGFQIFARGPYTQQNYNQSHLRTGDKANNPFQVSFLGSAQRLR
jgi:hypothetical protein